MDKQEIVVKEFNGVAIQIAEGKEVNLTSMWRASGGILGQEVWRWLETEQSTKFINSLAKKLNTPKSGVLKTQRGRYFGGIWGSLANCIGIC